MSEKKEEITITYSEPVEYFPKEIREKYFGEVERKKGKKEKMHNKAAKGVKGAKVVKAGSAHIYVRTKDPGSRVKLIEFLEKEGFTVDDEYGETKQSILELNYPIKVYFRKKTYGVIHNTTCAATAVSSGAVITVEEFYKTYMTKV
ncbi:MAG: hypothetical protein K6G45_06970 [Lachnospiraceae bacterium]|nr:hypothetical protein [Lachnospiraceae bacterium]